VLSLKIDDVYIIYYLSWLTILHLYILNLENNLCYFLSNTKLGLKNIYTLVLFFISIIFFNLLPNITISIPIINKDGFVLPAVIEEILIIFLTVLAGLWIISLNITFMVFLLSILGFFLMVIGDAFLGDIGAELGALITLFIIAKLYSKTVFVFLCRTITFIVDFFIALFRAIFKKDCFGYSICRWSF